MKTPQIYKHVIKQSVNNDIIVSEGIVNNKEVAIFKYLEEGELITAFFLDSADKAEEFANAVLDVVKFTRKQE